MTERPQHLGTHAHSTTHVMFAIPCHCGVVLVCKRTMFPPSEWTFKRMKTTIYSTP